MDEMTNWQNSLFKHKIDVTTSWWNSQPTKQQVDDVSWTENDK